MTAVPGAGRGLERTSDHACHALPPQCSAQGVLRRRVLACLSRCMVATVCMMVVVNAGGCGDGCSAWPSGERSGGEAEGERPAGREGSQARSRLLDPPPFALRSTTKDVLWTWFDEEGVHTTSDASEVPADARSRVRVQPLRATKRAKAGAGEGDPSDEDALWTTNLNETKQDGTLPVYATGRATFERWVREAMGAPSRGEASEAAGESGQKRSQPVVLYGADWCGVCDAAAAYMRKASIPFVEKNIETDPGARAEMMRKLQRAGLQAGGIPVIDVRGTVLQGFDPNTLSQVFNDGPRR